MLTAFDNATCSGSFGLASAARYEFRYSAHPLSFQYSAFVRGRLCFGWFSPFTPDYECAADLVSDQAFRWAQVFSSVLLIRGYGSLLKSPHSCVSCGQIGGLHPFKF